MKQMRIPIALSILNLGVLAAVIWKVLPETVPMHANLVGEIDRWGPRWILLLFGLLPILMAIGAAFYLRYTAQKQATANRPFERKLFPLLTIVFVLISWFPVAMALTAIPQNDKFVMPAHLLQMFVCIPVGILMLVIGNYSGKLKPNRLVGIRVKWTLQNPEVWRRTHRLSSYFLVAGALLLIAGSLAAYLLEQPILAIIGILALLVSVLVIPLCYASWLYHKLEPEQKK